MAEQFEVVDFFLQRLFSLVAQFLSLTSEHLSSHLFTCNFALQKINSCKTASSQPLQRFKILLKSTMRDSFLEP